MGNGPFRYLEGTVYPSEEKTMAVQTDDQYDGAHKYYITNCMGFNDGKTEYTPGEGQVVQFIMKLEDGTIIPGVQSEQLVLMLLDRHEKLNKRFPSEQYEKMKAGLEMFLEACKERVESRMSRGVMGILQK
jgi:hypothetical protein